MAEKCGVHGLDRDQFRANLLLFTRKAYQMLPPLKRPRILDIGCGSGVPTLELAQISGGEVTGIDADQRALDKLKKKAAAQNLSEKVTVVCITMREMVFPPDSFDIVWTEGAIAFIGYESSLKEWKKLLVPGGFLVMHDRQGILKPQLNLIEEHGFNILGQFDVSQDDWWRHYYAPLKKYLDDLRTAEPEGGNFRNDLRIAEAEVNNFDRNSEMYASMFIILEKRRVGQTGAGQ